MTSLTLPSILLVLLGAFTKLGYPRAMALAGATSAGAAVALGTRVVIPTFDAVALGAMVILILLGADRAIHRRPVRPIPGMLPLLLFALWTTCITAVGALLFAGTPVLDATGKVVPLGQNGPLSVSNLAQLAYLWIGLAVVVILARGPTTGASVLGLGLAVAILLNTWALLHRDIGVPFPDGFFDNSTRFRFIESAPGGALRFRGIMSEPSALASISIAALVFSIAYLPQSSGWRRAGIIALAGLALWNGLVSTSTSFIVTGLIMIAVAIVTLMVRLAIARVGVSPGIWIAISGLSIVLVFALPSFMNYVAGAISAKIESSSYTARSGADVFSFSLSLRTFGIGVGLGSNRPSSFVASLLSQTGVVGLTLFIIAVLTLIWHAIPHKAARPALWVMTSILLGKLFNGPDLGDPTGLLWLTMGVLAHFAATGQGDMHRSTRLAWPLSRRGSALLTSHRITTPRCNT